MAFGVVGELAGDVEGVALEVFVAELAVAEEPVVVCVAVGDEGGVGSDAIEGFPGHFRADRRAARSGKGG